MGLLTPSLPRGEIFGILAEFASPKDLFKACERRCANAGYKRWDGALRRFPVHGPRRGDGGSAARGLPYVTLGLRAQPGAISGFRPAALGERHRVSALDQRPSPCSTGSPNMPINVRARRTLSRRSRRSFGMLAFNQLPMHFHPLFGSKAFEPRNRRRLLHLDRGRGTRSSTRSRPSGFSRQMGAKHVELVKRTPEAMGVVSSQATPRQARTRSAHQDGAVLAPLVWAGLAAGRGRRRRVFPRSRARGGQPLFFPWLVAFMYFLSIAPRLFFSSKLTLFVCRAGWSVALRRVDRERPWRLCRCSRSCSCRSGLGRHELYVLDEPRRGLRRVRSCRGRARI